jgi:Domain of unknown function (DUF4394)
MTKKKITILTLITLALAVSLTFGLMGNRSASANTSSNLSTAVTSSPANLSAQFLIGGTYAIDFNSVLYVMPQGSTTFNTVGTISPINGTRVIGVDFRPGDGQLYAVTDAGSLYTVNLANANATLVSNLNPVFPGGLRSLTDFNPVADAIRLIAADGNENYAVVKNAAGILNTVAIQTSVAYADRDVFAGTEPNITGGGYTNNIAGAQTTLFYAFDYVTDRMVTIANKANGSSATGGGQLQTIGLVFANGQQLDFAPMDDMDIITRQDLGGLNLAYTISSNSLVFIFLSQINPNLQLGQTQNIGGYSIPINFAAGPVTPVDVALPIPTQQ